MNLMDALNSRLDASDAVVPTEDFMITQTIAVGGRAEPPPPVQVRPGWTRPLQPGEVGSKTMQQVEIPYSDVELKALLARVSKGAAWMMENLDNPESDQRLGLLVEIIDAAHLLLYARMSDRILNEAS